MTESDTLRTLHFYFDYISSNAYLAWVRLLRLAEPYGLRIEPVPVLFAALLEAHAQVGPAEVRPKARWMSRNNLRKAALLGVPLRPPVHHPFNPLLALRVSSLELPAAERAALVGALFRAVWVDRLHVSEPEVVMEVAAGVGLAGAELVRRAGLPETKQRLRARTHTAIEAGVFGVPTCELGGELFFGFDDLPYLEMVLAGNDPLDPEALAEWQAGVPDPSAMRRRFRETPPASWKPAGQDEPGAGS